MDCLCEVLDPEQYSVEAPVAIIEDPKALRRIFAFGSEKFMDLYQIDSRLLTACFESLDPRYLRVIVVYDYLHFCSDWDLREAIIFHELGHIVHPVTRGTNLEAEVMCDLNAVKHGFRCGTEKMLSLLSDMAGLLQIPPLMEVTKARVDAFSRLGAGF